MKKSEAIEYLQNIKYQFEKSLPEEGDYESDDYISKETVEAEEDNQNCIEALEMAIKALQRK
jgi:hypothetical protein